MDVIAFFYLQNANRIVFMMHYYNVGILTGQN